jgi:hypothetical protein
MNTDRDDILDDLRAALAIEPSPSFEARVRAAAATDAEQRRNWWPWLVAAGACAALAVVAATSWPRAVEVQPARMAATFGAPATPPAVSAPSTSRRSARPIASRATSTAPVRRREPEVLVPRDQAIALDRLIRGISEGRATLALAGWPEGPVVVEPLPAIVPVRVDALPEGTPSDPIETSRFDS